MDNNVKLPIQLQIHHQLHSLHQQHFHHYVTIVTKIQLEKYNHVQLKITSINIHNLHVFIYYIVALKNHLNLPEYRNKCLKQLSQHYVQSHMNIPVYNYGYFCSQLQLGTLEECIHIIYFLIYGRYASVPYVRLLCRSKRINNTNKRHLKNSKKGCNFQQKDFQSVKLNSKKPQQSPVTLQNFVHDLKQQLRVKTSDHHQQHSSNLKVQGNTVIKRNNKKYNRLFIPNSVRNKQNSAIIECIRQKQLSRSSFRTTEKPVCRLQKFNETCINYSLFNKIHHLQHKQEETANKPQVTAIDGQCLKSYDGMLNEFKNNNSNLDLVRNECLEKDRQNIKFRQDKLQYCQSTDNHPVSHKTTTQWRRRKGNQSTLPLHQQLISYAAPSVHSQSSQSEQETQVIRTQLRNHHQPPSEINQQHSQIRRKIKNTQLYRKQLQQFNCQQHQFRSEIL